MALKLNGKIPELKIGSVVTIGRTEYTILAKVEDKAPGRDKTEVLYWGRKKTSWGYSYANVIRWIPYDKDDEESSPNSTAKWGLRT